jgi:vitamin B12 transporter
MCGSAAAEEVFTQMKEVVVTATRDEVPIEQVGSSITVVTAKEIELQQKQTVADVLRMVPGLDVVRSGGAGQTVSIFMRGADSRHTLVLIDGVELNDPSTTGGEYYFGFLTKDNIERIEVLRGPQSTLYGSHAIGGVINIITKRGSGRPTGFVSAEGGSLYTARESAGISGSTDLVNYSLSLSRLDSSGISAAASRDGNREADGYQNTAVAARLGITPTQNSDIDMSLRYTKTRNEADNGGGAGADDPNRVMRNEELQFRTQGTLLLFNDLWEQKLGVSINDLTRSDDNDRDADHPLDFQRSEYQGQTVKFDWQHILRLHKSNTLLVGAETKEEKAQSRLYLESSFGPYTNNWAEQSARTNGLYLQDQLNLWDNWFSTAGVRLDDHDRFGSKATYRFTTAYLFKQTDTRLKGSYGTGFKAPSLYQLFDPANGNANLKPEKSTGWDVGIEQVLLNRQIQLGATYFRNDYEQLIDWELVDPVWYIGMYKNVAKTSSKGVELTASYQPIDSLVLRAGYTYNLARDKETGEALLRRPKHKLTADVNYRFLDKGNLNLGLVYVGRRTDDDFSSWPPTTVRLKGYTLVNLAGSYDVTKNLQFFGRVDNLLDREYEEVYGYGTPGISAYGGVKVSF